MASKYHDIAIEQGSTFYFTVNAKNRDGTIKDLTGYTAEMQIRHDMESSEILVDASTTNGLITIIGVQGQVNIIIPGATTAGYDWHNGVYDLKVDNGAADVVQLVHGNVALNKQVTRS